MKRIVLITAMLSLLSITQAFSQAAGNVIYNNHDVINPQRFSINLSQSNDMTANITAEVLMNVAASSYTVIFSATQSGATAIETDSLMNVRLYIVKQELMKAGIKQKEIHIDLISFVPSYSLKLEGKKFSRTANEIPIGFQLKKNIHVIIYNYDLLDKITSVMAKSEIYDIVKVDYNLDNLKLCFDTLRKEAIRIIRAKEKTYNEMGLYVKIESMFDGFNAVYPLERYASYTAYYTGSSIEEIRMAKKKKEKAASSTIIKGNNTTVNINVNDADDDDTEFIVKYSDKNKTIYYNRIPYNQFDNILNADYAEPRIQLVYSIKAKYRVENLENHDENKRLAKEAKEGKEKKGKRWI